MEKGRFHFSLLTDGLRSQRESLFSKLVMRLSSKYPNFSFTPFIQRASHNSRFRKLLGSKFGEMLGVMHMKFAVFDDSVVIMG